MIKTENSNEFSVITLTVGNKEFLLGKSFLEKSTFFKPYLQDTTSLSNTKEFINEDEKIFKDIINFVSCCQQSETILCEIYKRKNENYNYIVRLYTKLKFYGFYQNLEQYIKSNMEYLFTTLNIFTNINLFKNLINRKLNRSLFKKMFGKNEKKKFVKKVALLKKIYEDMNTNFNSTGSFTGFFKKNRDLQFENIYEIIKQQTKHHLIQNMIELEYNYPNSIWRFNENFIKVFAKYLNYEKYIIN